jgi:excisionase family DNA binding protein
VARRELRRRPKPRQLSSGELAGMSGLSKRSVVKAIADGKLKAARTVGGHYRISLPEARRFMRRRGLDTAELEARENCALVVARDRFVGDLLADVLGRAGVEVLQSECLFRAGELAAKYRPWMVIIDAASAGPDPAGVCRSVAGSDSCREARILVLTGGGAEEKKALRQAGAHGVLDKPFSVKQLKDKLRDLGFSTGSFRRVSK